MKRKSLRLRGRDHKEADEKNGCQIFNILNFFLFIVFYSAMRALLVVYFIFCIIADPWVDSVSLEFDSHVTTGQITNITVSQNLEATQILNLTKNHESHQHNDCPESCPEHTCHLGHCGVLISSRIHFLPAIFIEQFSEYRQSIPNSPVFGIRRPPKSNA